MITLTCDFVNNNFERADIILKNQEIREAAKAKNIYLWQIAEKLGMQDSAFSRKLRRELSAAEKAKILAIIDELSAEKQENEVTV